MKTRIAFLGDSLTEGGKWDVFFPNHELCNYGVSGEKSVEILSRLDQVLAEKPNQIFLMMGINDLGDGVGKNDILNNFSELISRLKKEPEVLVVVQSLLPVNFQLFASETFCAKDIRDINKLLKTFCEKEMITFVDLYSLFSTYSDELIKEYTYDGLHLNSAGYRLWVNCLQSENLI
ncbi:GDSL-type esterase/lipase family protein [Marinifilum sp. RC60d5]|uniref:GDSL-type esterase/lipase family protein n=1 Tax=Marinifilum sp. RC60d5 TaxID=3458414 RepID=UPI0040363666